MLTSLLLGGSETERLVSSLRRLNGGDPNMTVVDKNAFVFDPWNVSWRTNDTEETLGELLENRPIFLTDAGQYVVSRYDDVREIMSNAELFSAKPNQSEAIGFPPKIDESADPAMLERLMMVVASLPFDVGEFAAASVIVGVDPPVHTRLRRIVNRGFLPTKMAALAPTVEAIVAECLKDINSTDSFEVMSELAVPVPIRVIAEILGVERQHCDDLKRWSDVLSTCVHGESRGTIESGINLVAMLSEFAGLFMPMIEERRNAPSDDVISEIIKASEADTLTVAEAVLFLLILMAAANETTTSLIGNAIPYLCENPEQLKLLIDQPDLLGGVVEETLRLSSPVQFVFREATADVTLQGVTIPQGSQLVCFIAAANRDPRQFPDPHRFDITRKGQHLSFGHGAHFCLGAALGRLEGHAALKQIAPSLSHFDFDNSNLHLDPSAFTRSFEVVRLTKVNN